LWAYYNEIDPYAAQWVRNLIKARLITDGEVDERPVQDVYPKDLARFTRCHFFAGIAGWDIALRLADFPADRPVWTGSCPCQGFSAAGKSLGFADERHLWPYWFHLIDQCRPPTIFGEQVASKLALEWLDLVHANLESAGYSVGTTDLCAAGVGAPHIRQRLWFVADNIGERHARIQREGRSGLAQRADDERAQSRFEFGGVSGELGDARGPRLQERERDGRIQREALGAPAGQAALGGSDAWYPCEWLPCTDGKARPVEPRSFPLAYGVRRRASKLRAYGNAIVPQVAAEFIKSCHP
jgi:DNA (cytosine-5)-methyltransferase 1